MRAFGDLASKALAGQIAAAKAPKCFFEDLDHDFDFDNCLANASNSSSSAIER